MWSGHCHAIAKRSGLHSVPNHWLREWDWDWDWCGRGLPEHPDLLGLNGDDKRSVQQGVVMMAMITTPIKHN